MSNEPTKRGPGRPPTRNKPHEGTERALNSGKLDERTKSAKQIKQNAEDFQQDPIAYVKAELEHDVAVNKLMKKLLVGYLANNADKLTPEELWEGLKRLTTLQGNTLKAYGPLLDALEG